MKAHQAMQCPTCRASRSRVMEKRNQSITITRRRECLECGHRFNTLEVATTGVPTIQDHKLWIPMR